MAEAVALLPTPCTMDPSENMTPEEFDIWRAKNRLDPVTGLPRSGNGHGDSIGMLVKRLLPTPTARDWKDGSESNVEENALLGRVVWNEERWGRYAQAIAIWEQTMGPAPKPTTGEKPRLNPDFVEWMMGYRSGWTFGTKTQRLKQLGNSVVPQQGEYAIKRLLASLRSRLEP